MIKSEKLCFTYASAEDGEKEASPVLKEVDVKIKKGEFVAILGRNGSGKSTFARHLNALLIPTGGTVWVNGIDTSQQDMIWEIRQSVGMVFQNPDNQLIATVVEEDIAFGPENIGVPSSEIRTRVDDALKDVGMSDFASHAPHNLSGGQKQRVAIAGILAMHPVCIVLDEPTAMLDPSGRREVMETITRLNRDEGITIILITHYMEEAVAADRVIVMDNGKMVMDDIPGKVFGRVEELKSLRLDVPQITSLAHQLRLRGFNVSDGILTVEDFLHDIFEKQED